MQSFSCKHFLFKPISEREKALIVALYTNETAMRFVEPVLTETEAIRIHQDFVKKNNRKDSTFTTWAIYPSKATNSNNTPQAIGFVVLYTSIGKQQLTPAEIGIMLLPKQSGKGLATKALSSFINYLFLQLHLPAIAMRFNLENKAMQTIAVKLGFKKSTSSLHKSEQASANNVQRVTLLANHWQAQKQPTDML